MEENKGINENSSSLLSKSQSERESIKVLVRIRPLNQEEYHSAGDNSSITSFDSHSLTLRNPDTKKQFQCSFDSVLGPSSTQEEVYSAIKICTSSVKDGFNSTIFAYGQTGSGKTHTMFGPPNVGNYDRVNLEGSAVGLIPRAIQEIFQLAQHPEVLQFSVLCSFVQLYNENCFDMLRDPAMSHALPIREEKQEIYVQGLSEYIVKSVTETLQLLRVAEEHRAIRETNMNQYSSRSHSIFQIYVEQKRVAEDGEINLKAKFNLVDLAGSEKWNTKLMMRDEHISELTNINLSLHTLGKCISALSRAAEHKEKEIHIPYRESKLTRLLQDSIGGNSRTFLIATLSPSVINVEESISTLKFADRAKQVMTQITINESRPVDHEMVMKLQMEVKYLKQLLKQYTEKIPSMDTLPRSTESSASHNHEALESAREPAQSDGISSAAENRIATLEKENTRLKREIEAMSQRNPTTSPRPPLSIPKPNRESQTVSSSIAENYSALNEQNEMLWTQADTLQTTLKKFFAYQIEEDVMRQLVEQVFVTLNRLKERRADLKASHGAPPQLRNGFDSPHVHTDGQSKTSNLKLTNPQISKLSPGKPTPPQNSNEGFLPRISVKGEKGSSQTFNPLSQSAHNHGLKMPSHSTDSNENKVVYRVRGPGSKSDDQSGSGWIAPPTKEEEEEEIRKSLARAKKKMKKNLEIQEWLKNKEDRINEKLIQEEEERKAMELAELEKEKQRRSRVQKQKKKLGDYYAKVKEEAEKIQEYKELGIDPTNLFE